MSHRSLRLKPLSEGARGPRGDLDVTRPNKTSDRLGHRQKVGVVREDHGDVAAARQHRLNCAHGKRYVNPLLNRAFGRSIPVAERAQPWNDQTRTFRLPSRHLPAIGRITEWIAALCRNAAMNLNPNELSRCASTIGSGQQKAQTIGAEVAPPD